MYTILKQSHLIKGKLVLTFFVLFMSFISMSQVGYLIKSSGEKVLFYKNIKKKEPIRYNTVLSGDVNLTTAHLFYYSKEGKLKQISQAVIKEAEFYGRRYISLNVTPLMKRLHEVIAENNKYIMTNYYSEANYLYIFDKKDLKKAIVGKELHSKKKKDDLILFEEKIKPYFENCPEVLEVIKKSIESGNYDRSYSGNAIIIKNHLFNSIANYNCNQE